MTIMQCDRCRIQRGTIRQVYYSTGLGWGKRDLCEDCTTTFLATIRGFMAALVALPPTSVSPMDADILHEHFRQPSERWTE